MLPVLGKKAVLEWCMCVKEGLIGSSYVSPKCGKSMELRERTGARFDNFTERRHNQGRPRERVNEDRYLSITHCISSNRKGGGNHGQKQFEFNTRAENQRFLAHTQKKVQRLLHHLPASA
ncbi:hypothetical protein TNCV_160261 [Trichonephila clavipes]|nr:hypothetical protein TNCV_160261 [Trichonephila clavipes]